MKFIFALLLSCTALSFSSAAYAQTAAQTDAKYIATLAAVMNYKINDEKIADDIKSLRENERFNKRLQKKMERLSNSQSRDAINRKVMDILEKTGKELDNLL